jgi:hypothetical protein
LKIELRTKPLFKANNITKASSKEFADLLRELEDKVEPKKIEGRFVIYREHKTPVMIELVFDKEEG